MSNVLCFHLSNRKTSKRKVEAKPSLSSSPNGFPFLLATPRQRIFVLFGYREFDNVCFFSRPPGFSFFFYLYQTESKKKKKVRNPPQIVQTLHVTQPHNCASFFFTTQKKIEPKRGKKKENKKNTFEEKTLGIIPTEGRVHFFHRRPASKKKIHDGPQ